MGRDAGWRDVGYSNEHAPKPRYWCSILSPLGHALCDKPYFCGCECHLPDRGEPTARWRKRLGVKYDPGAVRVAGRRQ